MKNKNLLILLFSVVLCIAIIVLAEEDQNETKVSGKKLQHSSVESSQNDLPKVLQVLQFRTTVTDQVTEEIPESVTETSPATTNINNETTLDYSVTTEAMEDINQNVTSETSILPKRNAVTPIPEEVSESEFNFEQLYSIPMTLEQLDNYSCTEEASNFGHKEATGVLIHEVICELRKLWHYIIIAVQNLTTEFQMELPIEAEEGIILLSDLLMNGVIIDALEQGIVHLEVFLENPENLNGFFDIIEKCIPMSHIHETISRLRIAFSNFFIHLQGFVIYLEPHQSIHNYIELFKEFEEKICAAIEKILDFFDIHLETEMKLVSQFTSSVKLLLMKFSFEKTVEENLEILKEFVDTLSETYKELHASESSESIIEKMHTVISTFISTFLPQNFNVPIVHFVLPNKSVATLSCIWQATNETSSGSVAISSDQNVTPISRIDIISSVLETEAKFYSELFSCLKVLLEKLCSEQTFEQHLKILKECIDELAEICKEYYEMDCSKSIIGRMQSLFSTFVSTLFTQDFELPILHFVSSDGSKSVLHCAWKVTNETSSISPLFPSKFNLTPIVEDRKIDQTKLLPENIAKATASSKSSVSIQNADNSAPISTNNPSESPSEAGFTSENVLSLSTESTSSPIQKDSSPKSSAAIIQPLVSTSQLQEPNHGSSNTISSSASAVSTIKLPTNHSPIEDKPYQYKTTRSPQEDSTKYSTQSSSSSSSSFSSSNVHNVPPSSPKVQATAEAVSSSSAFLPSADTNPEKDSSQPNYSVKASAASSIVTLNSSPPSGTNTQNEQQPVSTSSPENPVDSSTNSPPIPPSTTEEPADSLTNNPPIPPSSSEEPADSLTTSSPIPPSPPEEPADSWTTSPPIPPSSTEEPADSLTNSPPIPSPSSEEPADSLTTNPPIPLPSPEEPADSSTTSPPIPPSSPEEPADSLTTSPPVPPPPPEEPADSLTTSPPIPPPPPEEPADSLTTSPPIPPSSPEEPPDSLTNSPPIPPSPSEEPADSWTTSPPVPSSPPEEPADSLTNSPPIPPSSPEEPADSSTTSPPIPPSSSEEPADSMTNSPAISPSPPEDPADSLTTSSPIPPSPPEEPTDSWTTSPSILPSAPEEPADSLINSPPISPSSSEEPGDSLTNSPPIPPSSSEEPADSLTTSSPIPASPPEEPTDSWTTSPSILPSAPEEPADSLINSPPISPSSSEEPGDSLTNSPPIPPSSSEEPADSLTTSSPIPASPPEEPADSWTTIPPIPSSPPKEPADSLANNLSIPSSSTEKPADFLDFVPSTFPSSSENPIDQSNNNSPILSPPSEEPSDLSNNNLPIFSSPAKPAELLSNSPLIPPYPLGRPAELSSNNPPIPLLVPEKPAEPSSNKPFIPPYPFRIPVDFSENNPPIPPYSFASPVDFSENNPPIPPYPFASPVDFSENSPPMLPYPFERPIDLSINNPPTFLPSPGRPTDFSVNNPLVPSYYPGKPVGYSNNPPVYLPSPGKSSPTVLFLGERRPAVEKNYNEPFNPLTPPSYLIPASDIIPNLPRYQPLSNSYANYLESADAFYKSLYSYLQYGNPAIEPPPNVSNKISEFLRRGFPPSLPMPMDNPNICGTSAFLPSLSALNNILKNNIRSSQFPLYVPRKEIASALGNTILSSGDLIIILPKNGVGLIGQVIDDVSPILFKVYEVQTAFTNPQGGIKIWHLRSGDFRNPECEQQLELLFKH